MAFKTLAGVAGCGVLTRRRSIRGLPAASRRMAFTPVPPISIASVRGDLADALGILGGTDSIPRGSDSEIFPRTVFRFRKFCAQVAAESGKSASLARGLHKSYQRSCAGGCTGLSAFVMRKVHHSDR